ncbi:hypothetical protein [Alicyclobacillus sp.]|uniref:hypothetical protein n=1 Tax=Alicyclobacillus sp. TaxID=61169 RepID=UPI0025BFD3EC|nr:hypothetical protein [Alicyclobacillus sp.]MCL6516257.1 hypothetical protein [Alicyclobacillus sp.]
MKAEFVRAGLRRAFSTPKVLVVVCLAGLGINGLLQVGLQHDMAARSAELQQQVARAQGQSGQMKSSVAGLPHLSATTAEMQNVLGQIEATTAHMDQGLMVLADTVAGIEKDAAALTGSTQASDAQIRQAAATAQALLAQVQDLQRMNADVVAQLRSMASDQVQINRDLEDMNAKTAFLP